MSLLGHAERERHLEDVFAAVGGAHFAGTRIEAPVGAAGWSCHTPAGLATHACRLTVLAAGLHHALAAGVQLHLARRVVHVAVGGADGSIFGRAVAVHGAGLTLCTGVAARTHVGELDRRQSDAARLHAQHAAIQIGASIGATDGILLRAAAMLAIRSFRAFTAISYILDQRDPVTGTSFLAQLAEIGVNEAIAATDGLRAHCEAGRARAWTAAGATCGTCAMLASEVQLLLLELFLQQILLCRGLRQSCCHCCSLLLIADQGGVLCSLRVAIAYDRRLGGQLDNLDGGVCHGAWKERTDRRE